MSNWHIIYPTSHHDNNNVEIYHLSNDGNERETEKINRSREKFRVKISKMVK